MKVIKKRLTKKETIQIQIKNINMTQLMKLTISFIWISKSMFIKIEER